MHKLEINIPFPGFYGTIYESAYDSEMESFVQYEAEKQSSLEYHPETYQPEHLRLEESDIFDAAFEAANFSQYMATVSRWYADAFNHYMRDNIPGLPKKAFQFASLSSPREYNFTTDRIFVTASLATVKKLFAISKADDHFTLAAIIMERFTSRDGFSSFYRTDLEEWLSKPLVAWDHNELGTLVLAALRLEEEDGDESFREEMLELTLGGDSYYQAWEEALDWKKYERLIQDKLDEKEAEFYEANPDMKPENMPPPYHCPLTLELPF